LSTRRLLWITLVFAAATVGCGAPTEPTPADDPASSPVTSAPAPAAPDASEAEVQARILLDRWTRSGGERLPGAVHDDPCAPHAPAVHEVAFELPAGRGGARATLVMPDLWWQATVTANGRELAPAVGAPGTAEVPLDGALKAGENRLRIVVEEASGRPLLETNGCLRTPELGGGVELILHPETWIRDGALVAEGEGVGAAVRVRAAPAGARVHAEAWLDGERLEWGGSAEVSGDGVARIAAAPWPGPRWRPQEADGDALVHLAATVVDDGGQVLDRATVRAGVRALTFADGELQLDGEPFRMMAIRADPEQPPHAQLAGWLAAGVNAVELHGRAPSPAWLAEADELGLPVVVLPRCDGPLWMGVQPGQRREQLETLAGPLAGQDRELAWRTAAHPSLALWACEGDADHARALCGGLTGQDPRGTPAAGVQLGSWPLPAEGLRAASPAGGPGPAAIDPGWIVELTGASATLAGAPAAATFVDACQQGAVGGVIPHPVGHGHRDAWTEAWASAARELSIPALATTGRRAGSRVQVRQLDPGQVAWLEVPGLTPVGEVAGAGGSVTLERWHRGQATVTVGGRGEAVELSPDTWRELARVSAAAVLDWDGAPPADR